MKIQRGIVKYKDRNDIVCTYALMDDGQQYYFLDETDSKRLSNGNRIATTALVEAIDPMVKATNIGVIDQNGVVVVPFENRSIRLANDNLLIVEKAVPTSQSVLDAIELRNDPTAATKLVSTPAAIKDRLKMQMGVEGNYLFNDQFSEATICDINGTNLVQGESFSFIAMANDRLYLSKNTVDSPISEFSLTTYEMTTPQAVDAQVGAIDVSSAAVDPQVVEGALNAGVVSVSDAMDQTVEAQTEPIMPSVPIVSAEEAQVPVPTEEGAVAYPVEGTENNEAQEEIVRAVIDTPESEMPIGDSIPMDGAIPTEETANENTFVNDFNSFTEGMVTAESGSPEAETDTPPIVEEANATDPNNSNDLQAPVDESNIGSSQGDLPPEENHDMREESFSSTVTANMAEEEKDHTTSPINIDAETVFATVDKNQNGFNDSDEMNISQPSDINISSDTSLTDIFNTTSTEPNSSYGVSSPFESTYTTPQSYSTYDSMATGTSSYESYGLLESDHLMSDVARSMSELMKRNKEQREAITQYQNRIDSLESQSRIISDKYKDQSMRYEALTSKLRSMEDAIGRLDSRNQLLENKVHDQEKIIASQDREIKILRPQVEGKQDLVRLLADARTLLGTDSNYGFEDGSSYYGGRVA